MIYRLLVEKVEEIYIERGMSYKERVPASLGEEFLPLGMKMKGFSKRIIKKAPEYLASFRMKSQSLEARKLSIRYSSGKKGSTAVFDVYPSRSEKAVVFIPHWTSNPATYERLASALSKRGFYVLVMHLPYHGAHASTKKDNNKFVNANIGKTISSVWTSIGEAKLAIDWLGKQGFKDIGFCGFSVGACISFILSAYDKRIKANFYVHQSTDFAKVVYFSGSTRHIKEELEKEFSFREVQSFWMSISPENFIKKARDARKHHLISGKYDLSFPFRETERFVSLCRKNRIDIEHESYSCGHFTLRHAPYSYMMFFSMLSFFRKNL